MAYLRLAGLAVILTASTTVECATTIEEYTIHKVLKSTWKPVESSRQYG